MTNEQIQALKAQMKRKRRDWTSGVMRSCDCCGQHEYTVMEDDGSAICAPCCDAEHVANLENIAETLLEERQADKALIAELQGRQKKLIGWRASDYTDETADPEIAKNWAAAIGVLPIFEGDVNTKLEARTLAVKLPDELYAIAENIRTQDNRCTDQPMFAVMQKREIIGSDEHSPSRIVWCWDGEEVSELRARRLEALHQGCRDTRGYDRYAMQEIDEFVTACFTEKGCKDYLARDGHNLRLPFIYAFGSFRNSEYQFVRKWLAGITLVVGGE